MIIFFQLFLLRIQSQTSWISPECLSSVFLTSEQCVSVCMRFYMILFLEGMHVWHTSLCESVYVYMCMYLCACLFNRHSGDILKNQCVSACHVSKESNSRLFHSPECSTEFGVPRAPSWKTPRKQI